MPGLTRLQCSPKMHVFEVPGERVITLLTSGNLAITQSVVNRLREAVRTGADKTLETATSMFEAATLVGDEIRAAFERDASHLKNQNSEFSAIYCFQARSRVRCLAVSYLFSGAILLKAVTKPRISR